MRGVAERPKTLCFGNPQGGSSGPFLLEEESPASGPKSGWGRSEIRIGAQSLLGPPQAPHALTLSLTLSAFGPSGDPIPDEMAHCLRCEVLWAATGGAAGDGPGRSALERVALGGAIAFEVRIGAVARLACE